MTFRQLVLEVPSGFKSKISLFKKDVLAIKGVKEVDIEAWKMGKGIKIVNVKVRLERKGDVLEIRSKVFEAAEKVRLKDVKFEIRL